MLEVNCCSFFKQKKNGILIQEFTLQQTTLHRNLRIEEFNAMKILQCLIETLL